MTDYDPYAEGPEAWALWQFVVARIPKEDVREFAAVMRDYRAYIQQTDSEKIRSLKDKQPAHWAGVRIDVAADLIHPGNQAAQS